MKTYKQLGANRKDRTGLDARTHGKKCGYDASKLNLTLKRKNVRNLNISPPRFGSCWLPLSIYTSNSGARHTHFCRLFHTHLFLHPHTLLYLPTHTHQCLHTHAHTHHYHALFSAVFIACFPPSLQLIL